MNIVVLLRAVADPELARGVWGDACRLDEASIVAASQALSLAAAVPGSKVTGAAVGPPEWTPALQEARALGIAPVTRAWSDGLAEADIVATATALAHAVPEGTDVVVAGSAAGDHGSGVLPAALAEFLGWPFLSEIAGVEPSSDGLLAHVRLGGGRRRTYRVPAPVVLAAARMPAPPFYPRLAVRLAARREAIPVVSPRNGTSVPQSRLSLAGYGPARPLTRHLIKPSAAAKPAERLRQLMSGGMGNRGGRTIEAANQGGAAQELAQILAREGLLPRASVESQV